MAEIGDAQNRIAREILDAAFDVHRALGPGLLESVYEAILARDLERRGLHVIRQKPISFDYDGLHFSDAGRIDLLVESQIVVELKSVERFAPVRPKQVLTYLRLLKLPLGLLINFGMPMLKDGICRIANSFDVNRFDS
ncbi:MAG TPA: GxxExxY protein [Rhizomicrobium sp.]|jgi:iron complex transport system substrate-binding protein